jgi:hypothetical protein
LARGDLKALDALYESAPRETPTALVRRAAVAEAAGRDEDALALYEAAVDVGMVTAVLSRDRIRALLGRTDDLVLSYVEYSGPPLVVEHVRYRAGELMIEELDDPELALLSFAELGPSARLAADLLVVVGVTSPEAQADALTRLHGAYPAAMFERMKVAALRAAGRLGEAREVERRLVMSVRDPALRAIVEADLLAAGEIELLANMRRGWAADADDSRDARADSAYGAGRLFAELGMWREASESFAMGAQLSDGSVRIAVEIERAWVHAALGENLDVARAITRLGRVLTGADPRAVCDARARAFSGGRLSGVPQAPPGPRRSGADDELVRLAIAGDELLLLQALGRAIDVETNPERRLVLGRRAVVALLRRGEFGDAGSLIARLRSAHPNDVALAMLQAVVDDAREDWAGLAATLEAISRAAEIDDEVRLRALEWRARVMLDAFNDVGGARACVARMRAIRPRGVSLGLLRIGIEEAVADFEAVLETIEDLLGEADLSWGLEQWLRRRRVRLERETMA